MSNYNPFSDHLTDDGLVADGTNDNMNVDGSSTPVPFYRGPPVGETWAIHRMIVLIEDNANFTADGYGGVATLTNGIDFSIFTGGVAGTETEDLLDGDPVNSVADWASNCYDMAEHTFGSGNNFIVIRWTFTKMGRPLILQGDVNDIICLVINDDLTGLVKHQAHIQGHQIGGKDRHT